VGWSSVVVLLGDVVDEIVLVSVAGTTAVGIVVCVFFADVESLAAEDAFLLESH
jgi:hypothetical protein